MEADHQVADELVAIVTEVSVVRAQGVPVVEHTRPDPEDLTVQLRWGAPGNLLQDAKHAMHRVRESRSDVTVRWKWTQQRDDVPAALLLLALVG